MDKYLTVNKLGEIWQKKMRISKRKLKKWQTAKIKADSLETEYGNAERDALKAYNAMARHACNTDTLI